MWTNAADEVVGTDEELIVTQAGTYTLTVTGANGCESTDEITIGGDVTLPGADIAASATTLTCTVNSITLTATGNGSYVWTNAADEVIGTDEELIVTQAGTYTLTVTGANGCESTDEITISADETLPGAEIAASATTLTCEVSSITLTASGNGSYVWTNSNNQVIGNSNQLFVTSADTYTLTVTGENGCVSVDNIVIGVSTAIEAVVTAIDHVFCHGSSTGLVTVSAAGGTPAYEFSIDGGDNWQASGTFSGLAAGGYTVLVRDATGCTVQVPVTINEPQTSDLNLGSAASSTQFLAIGNEVTVVYNIAEIGGKPGSPVKLRIFKAAGYDLLFDGSATSVNAVGGPYPVENANWTLTDENAFYYEFTRSGPLPCYNLKFVGFTLKRNTPNKSTFNLNCVLMPADSEVNFNNNINSILFVAE